MNDSSRSNTFAVLNEDGEADIDDDFETESGFTRLVRNM
jgi:hypothetical protein